MLRLPVLSNSGLNAIHHATLRILSEVGVVMTQPKAREILPGAGATVWGDRLLLPPDLVEGSVAQCPRQVMVRGRTFLDQRHTVRYLRAGEMLVTHLAERSPWGDCDLGGRKSMLRRAQAQARRLLAEHEVPPLTEGQKERWMRL